MGAPRLSDVGIVTLEITAQTKTPADSDVQIDQVGFEPAPKCYSSVGRCYGSINKPGASWRIVVLADALTSRYYGRQGLDGRSNMALAIGMTAN
jgi:hypothetical protein